MRRSKKSYSLPDASTEQLCIIESICNGSNVIVDSVAGSGKTTCILHSIIEILKRFPDKRIAVLTYSKNLKEDSREKLKLLKMGDNTEIHSYHSFCVKYYTHEGMVDEGIIYTIKDNIYPMKHINFDILFLDEVQDMNALFYEFVCKMCSDNAKSTIQICIFGDRRQCIFNDLRNSDSRYIILSDTVFDFEFNTNKVWERFKLSVSYRLTEEMANFLNECMLHEKRITTIKSNSIKIEYHICDSFNDSSDIIQRFLGRYSPGDILVISNTAKNNGTPFAKTAELISNSARIPVFRDSDGYGKPNDKTWNNKIVFTTIHKVKGLERKVVVLFGFDSFFEFNRKDKSCPDIFYVAASRATERLCIIHDSKQDFLPWLDRNKLSTYADVTGYVDKKKDKKRLKFIRHSVTSFIDFKESLFLSECIANYLIGIQENEMSKSISFKSLIHEQQANIYEEVSNITGIIIPALFEFVASGEISFFSILPKELDSKT